MHSVHTHYSPAGADKTSRYAQVVDRLHAARLTRYPNMRRHDVHAELAASQRHSSQRTHVSSHVPQYTCQCVRQPSRDLAYRACQLSHQNARAYGCRKSEYDISESPQHTLSLTEFIPLGGSVPVMKTSRSSALERQEAARPCQNAQHSPRVPTQRAPARQSVRRSARAARALAIETYRCAGVRG